MLLPQKDYGERIGSGRDAQGVSNQAVNADDPRLTLTYGEFPTHSMDALLDCALERYSRNQNNNDNQNSTNNNNSTSNNHHGYIPTVEQAQRYMRYATATYGDVMIRAVQLDLWGGGYHPPHYHSDDHWRLFTNTTLHTHRICSHVGVPHKDLVQQRLLDDDDDDDDNLKWYHHHDHSVSSGH